jgi:hypothetical protein
MFDSVPTEIQFSFSLAFMVCEQCCEKLCIGYVIKEYNTLDLDKAILKKVPGFNKKHRSNSADNREQQRE